MKKPYFTAFLLLVLSLLFSVKGYSQTETIPAGSFLVNMGNTNTLSINDDVRPYGMIYDLMKNYNVPVKWVIATGKAKDGADFIHNGIIYKGGTFIIPAGFRTATVNTRIAFWQTQGVVGVNSVSDFSATVYKTLTSAPRWTLDAANGSIAQAYLTAAGINLTAFPGAYNWKAVSALDCCDDFFVMPHADPTWATHNRLFSWNKDCLGSIWAACHAVSALENSINPANATQQMNFLSTRTAATTPTPWPNNSLKLWGSHSGGSIPYTHRLFDNPVAQYMGVTDFSQLNGSEQIYIPKQSTDAGGATRWRPGANIIAYDPTQADVPSPDVANGNAAAVIVYGRGMDDPTRGYVMYEGGHNHFKGTISDGPALRAFLNFSFFQVQPKAPQLGTMGGLTTGQLISNATPVTVSISATSPLPGITFTYQWVSGCGGVFSNPNAATTTFTAPSVATETACTVSVIVTDNCGRKSFQSIPVIVVPPPRPPVTINDAATIQPECGPASVTKNVLSNDTDPDGDPITLTLVNGNAGSFTTLNGGQVSFTAAGVITYVSAEGFTGVETLTYTVCDNTTPLCTTGTYTITVGDANKVPTVVNDAVTIAEDNLVTISVLTNDIQTGGYTGGALSVKRVSSLPANGRVSVNSDNTITYIPNTDFGGLNDVFSYEVINTSGYTKTATVTVTVTNDACDGGTYQTAAGTNVTNTVNINPTADTWMNGATGLTANNYGGDLIMRIDRDNNQEERTIVKWGDLSAIPAGATINFVTIQLYKVINRGFSINVYQMTEDWTEGTGTNATPNATNDASWTRRITGTNWTAPNVSQGSGGTGPFNSTVLTNITSAVNNAGAPAYVTWATSAALQTLVSNWRAGTTNNYGLMFRSPDGGGNASQDWHSRTNTNPPILAVNYTTTTAPTCATIPARAPLANPDYGYTTVNTSPLVISNVKANDTDDGTINVTGATIISGGGSVGTITGNGFTYTPVAGTTGTVVVEYTISDGTLTDVARVTIVVTGTPIDAVNDNPAAANSGVAQNINVMANDVDPENQKGILTIITQPANGTATVNNNSTPANFADDFIVYTPAAGFYGTDNFVYQVCEALPAATCPVTPFCDQATVTVTVNNQPPVANNDNVTVLPCTNTTINLLTNDVDPEGKGLTITVISPLAPPGSGTLINNLDGTVTFIPTTGFTGIVTFTYNISDDGGLTSIASATVTMNVVNPVNIAPIALDDAEAINMDQTYYFSVLDNDSDPNNHAITIPTIITPPLHGTVTVLVNGLLQYTSNPGYYGTDIIVYRIFDRVIDAATCSLSNGLSDDATLTITILPPLNTTNAFNDEHSTWQDVNVSGNVQTNDNDAEAEVQVLGGFFNKDNGMYVTSGTINVYAEDGVTLAGALTIDANGNFTFDPAPAFIGVMSVPYFVSDIVDPNLKSSVTDTALLKITVNPLPAITNSIIANNDEYVTAFNTNVVSSVTAYNDFDPQGNSFTVTAFTYDNDGDPATPNVAGTVGAPAITIGGVSSTGIATANAGTLILNADGTFTFDPQNDFTGSIDVVYTITDALGASTTAILHIDILPDVNGVANDAPFAGDDFKYTSLNTPVSGSALPNDSDPNAGQTITVTNIGGTAVSGATTVATLHGSITINPDGTYTYTPTTGYTGPDAITYTICDNGTPVLCADATLYFLTGTANTTEAINDENSTWQDVNVSGGVMANDYDLENNTQSFGSFLLQNLTGDLASGATVSGVDKTGATIASAGTLTFAADGTYTFDPAATFTGTVTIPYRICDNGNLSKCDTAFLFITVDPLPTTGLNTVIANNDENISYGAPVSSNLFVNDADPQNNLFAVTTFNYDTNGDGLPDASGTPGTLVTVAGVDINGNPVANAGTLTINANGTYTYTPTAGFVGKIDVPYIITDALGAVSGAILHIDVLANSNGSQNDAPFAADDFDYTTINIPVSGSVLPNDSDPNAGQTLTVTNIGGTAVSGATTVATLHGSITINPDGTYTYTPNTGYTGPDAITYTICDNGTPVLCADAVIYFLVGPGINISGKVWDDANGNVIDAGISEPETNAGGTLYVNLVNGAGNVVATATVAADGSYSFSDITPGISYSLVLSTTQGTIGNAAPAAALPAGWTGTGENRNGTIDLGVLNVIDNLTYGFTNTANFDFGIEQLPDATVQNYTIPTPALNSFLTLNGTGAANSPAQLSGTDPEDGTIGAGNTMTITSVPTNAELYYDFGAGPVLLSNNTSISNYDPAKLQVKFTTLGSQIITFSYSISDAAGKADPTAATYTINLLNGLPVEGLSLSANLSGTTVTLNWKTLSESNTSYFEIERSTDNRSFAKTGRQVSAAGSSVNEKLYKQTDEIKDLQAAAIVYYRIKLTDVDGKISYSNVAAIRITKTVGIKAWPNPFVNSLQVQINSVVNTEIELRITDVKGRTILVQRNQVIRGNNQLSIENLHRLASGTYLLEVINKSDLSTTNFKLIRQ